MATIAIWAVIHQVYYRRYWRLAALVCRFGSHVTDKVMLHYDQRTVNHFDFPTLARQCGETLDSLNTWFGRPLRHRPALYLFHSSADVGRVFGCDYGGYALQDAKVVFVAADTHIREVVRHELAHLFAFRWNLLAPPLLSEGLPVWLQGTDHSKPIDAMAWNWIGEPGMDLRSLLNPKNFFASPNVYAMLHGGREFQRFSPPAVRPDGLSSVIPQGQSPQLRARVLPVLRH